MSANTLQFYADLYRLHGTSARALSYNSAHSQHLRFRALLPILPAERGAPFSLLDVGCGFGDLCGVLGEAGYTAVDYAGVDLMPEFVAGAAARWPEARFRCGDFAVEDLGAGAEHERFDYVVCSGAMNLHHEGFAEHVDFVAAMMERMYRRARLGVAFNLLSEAGRDLFPNDRRFFFSAPERVLARARALAPDTELDHGYLSYDFTIRSRLRAGSAGVEAAEVETGIALGADAA